MIYLIKEENVNDILETLQALNCAIHSKCYKQCFKHKNIRKHDFFEMQFLVESIKNKIKKGIY